MKTSPRQILPGDCVSANHYFSPIQGRLLHTFGKERTGYTCGSLLSTMQVEKYLTSLNSPQMRPKQFGLLGGSNQWHETKDSIFKVTMSILESFLLRNSRIIATKTASSFRLVGSAPRHLSTYYSVPQLFVQTAIFGVPHLFVCFLVLDFTNS